MSALTDAILAALRERPRSVSELAEALNKPRETVRPWIRELVSRGEVTRISAPVRGSGGGHGAAAGIYAAARVRADP